MPVVRRAAISTASAVTPAWAGPQKIERLPGSSLPSKRHSAALAAESAGAALRDDARTVRLAGVEPRRRSVGAAPTGAGAEARHRFEGAAGRASLLIPSSNHCQRNDETKKPQAERKKLPAERRHET